MVPHGQQLLGRGSSFWAGYILSIHPRPLPLPDAAAGTSAAPWPLRQMLRSLLYLLDSPPFIVHQPLLIGRPVHPAVQARLTTARRASISVQMGLGWGGVKMTGSQGRSAALSGTPSSVPGPVGLALEGTMGQWMPPRRVVPAAPLGVVPAGSVDGPEEGGPELGF